MPTKTRRSITDEFKQEDVSLLETSGRLLTQVAEALGVQPSMLRNWRDGRRGAAGSPTLMSSVVRSVSTAPAEQAEIRRLQKERARAQMERAISWGGRRASAPKTSPRRRADRRLCRV
jgi:transposase